MLKQKSLRERIGVVPQATTLFNDTLGANIAYGKKGASDEEINEALQAAQLSNFVDSLPGECPSSFRRLYLVFFRKCLNFACTFSQRAWKLWLEIVV